MLKKRKTYTLLFLIFLEFAAVWYDAVCNQARVIRPIDVAAYQFRRTDLPLMAATVLLIIYVFYLAAGAFVNGVRNARKQNQKVTRTINPHFGWFGFAGFAGFLGIPVFMTQQQVWPFFFFMFFGFFGFFYEGKLSSTLMDERFQEESARAQLVSYRIGFVSFWAVTWLLAMLGKHIPTQYVALIFSATSSLIIALVLFLSQFLLYQYDAEDVT